MTIALLDGDLFAFRCAASAEGDPAEVAITRADKWLRDTLTELDTSEYKCFMTGKNNFRYELYSEYKANRKDRPKPRHLQVVREFLEVDWKAEIVDPEADDLLGIFSSEDTVSVSNDKDMHQIPGLHYDPVKKELMNIGAYEAEYNFWSQMMLGDRSDNVPGFDGVARTKMPKFIQEMMKYMYDFEKDVWEKYEDKYQFLINYNLLHIWRKPSDLNIPQVVENVLAGTGLYEPGQEVTLELLLSTKPYLSQLSGPTE